MRKPALLLHAWSERVLRLRLAYPVILTSLLAILVVSEFAYQRSRAAISFGIALTDARIAGMRALQLITDAETAQRGYLLTGRDDYLAPFAVARDALPGVLSASLQFVADSDGAQDAALVRRLVDAKLSELSTTVAMYAAGRRQSAIDVVAFNIGQDAMEAIRSALGRALDNATVRQASVRKNIYDSISLGRWSVVLLSLAAAWALTMYMRRLARDTRQGEHERERLEAEVATRTADLRVLASHLQSVREDERGRLARELHDELGGLLTAAKLDTARIRAVDGLPSKASERLVQVIRRLDEVVALKRRIIENLHPSALDHLGLRQSLVMLCQEVGERLGSAVACELQDVALAADAQLTVYRLVQEALTNVQKYAAARQVRVVLRQQAGEALVTVEDDGVGFDLAGARIGRHGLAGMRYRVEALGGRMQLASAPGQGTRVSAWLPLAG